VEQFSPIAELAKSLGRGAAATKDERAKQAIKVLFDSLFPLQQSVITDRRSPYKSLCCSRRAGKTTGIGRWLLMTALGFSSTEIIYFCHTLKHACEIIWDGPEGLPAIVKQFGLDELVKIDQAKHMIKVFNGTILHVAGCETKADAASWTGHKYKLCLFDESQDIPEEILVYTVQEVLTPTLIDHRGEIVLAGVPRVWCAGMWYEAANDTGAQKGIWAHHGWDMFKNPHLDKPREWLDGELALKGQTEDDPTVQRNYFGRWVRDEKAQLFQYLPGRNDFDGKLPGVDDRGRAIEWNYLLSMDIGRVDLSTFVLKAWSMQSPNVYNLKAEGHQGILLDKIAAIIRTYQMRYGGPSLELVADTGGLGQLLYDNLAAIHGLFVKPAVKQEKAATIREMNTAMRLGRILYGPGCKALTDQLQALEMDQKTQIEKKDSPCDYADADLYGWRWTYSHTFEAKKAPPTKDEAALMAWNAEQERAVARFTPNHEKAGDEVLREMEAFDEALSVGVGFD
jgi:hypothetical protein